MAYLKFLEIKETIRIRKLQLIAARKIFFWWKYRKLEKCKLSLRKNTLAV